MINLNTFDLNAVMTSVLESGVLFKDSGLWQYYLNDSDFINEKEHMQQNCNEDFESFIKRLVVRLTELEAGDDEPIVSINYAIYSSQPKKFVKCAPINGYGCDCVDKCNFHIY